MKIEFMDSMDDQLLTFAIILSKYKDKWVLCKHRERSTYEFPGGKREPGEKILDTAARELQEETGALEFTLQPICVFSLDFEDERGVDFGLLCHSEIFRRTDFLQREIEKILLLEEIPDNLTYPVALHAFLREAKKRGVFNCIPDSGGV